MNKNTNDILMLQAEISELSRSMYKTWSRTGSTLRANEEHLKSLTKRLDQMIQEARTTDEKSARSRRLGY
jgi:hypothetical protein